MTKKTETTETEPPEIVELVRVKLDALIDIVALYEPDEPGAKQSSNIDYHLVRYKQGASREPVEVRPICREDVEVLLTMRSKAK